MTIPLPLTATAAAAAAVPPPAFVVVVLVLCSFFSLLQLLALFVYFFRCFFALIVPCIKKHMERYAVCACSIFIIITDPG